MRSDDTASPPFPPAPAAGIDALVLPDAPAPSRRSPIPLFASVVPVAAAVGLWLATGSVFVLWFAALGPLIAVAGVADAARSARRERRGAARRLEDAKRDVVSRLESRHAAERAERWRRHPDVAGLVADDAGVWRAGPELLVVGRGVAESSARVVGADGDADADELRAQAVRLADAPVTVPAVDGVAVVGPAAVASAVARALAMQLCLASPPGRLHVAGPSEGELAWSALLPHRRLPAPTTLRLGDPVGAMPGEIVIASVREGEHPPPGCGAILTLEGPDAARLDRGGHHERVRVEGIGAAQATALASTLADRASRAIGLAAQPDAPVAFGALAQPDPDGGLAAAIGVDGAGPALVDLVADGPHALVAGMTGAGKSELLITWATALCAHRSPDEVALLLADFKGGTAFDMLAALPHVTGVLTDLDGTGARRAIDSLRAELRHRERVLAEAGARDIRDPAVALPRLVVVVDEFAALLEAHAELQSVFVDVAARGRALGVHLVLGTQRAAGVVRDALLANCPLRICLRVTDAADSRTTVGTDEAALLPGGPEGRGLAMLRRAGDARAARVRVALTSTEDVAAVARRHAGSEPPRRPWHPELPRRIELDELVAIAPGADRGILLGMADEPHRQRQDPARLTAGDRGLLVVGGAGSGKTNVLDAVAAQVPAELLRVVPRDLEGAWDAIVAVERDGGAGRVLVLDDVDLLLARFPPDYAQALAERLERVLRGAGDAGVQCVVSAQRLTGVAGRLGELLPRRAVLAARSRTDRIALGGDPALHEAEAIPGRGEYEGRLVQFALAPARPPRRAPSSPPAWRPAGGVFGVVVRPGPDLRRYERSARDASARWMSVEDAAAGLPGDRPTLVHGDAESWQRGWRVLSELRHGHGLLIDAACAGDYRVLTGDRSLPPFCVEGAGRAWLILPGEHARRVRVSADTPSAIG